MPRLPPRVFDGRVCYWHSGRVGFRTNAFGQRCRESLDPQVEAILPEVGDRFLYELDRLLPTIARTEMPDDDFFILEAISPRNVVVEMHVSVLMNFVFPMVGRQKRHL